ncbi:MAG: basic amino acid/polyamine antiporter, family [Verrucomicrobiota bacterium]|jgi:APA family basic amino acid/polyamine antiporter|nr:basic amino acid/polyamine antiporter, family [Verrucomicrobiota bacterium]
MIAKKISALTATNLVVANMIGTGVFTSLGFQVAGITSDFALIALWIVGGIAALCGALSYAELATALPRSGGEYHYLSKIYHPSVGFLSGWISVVVGFPAPIALAGIAFGGYFKIFTPGISPIFLSLLIIWIVTAVHLFGLRVEEMFQNGSTFLKIGLVLVLIVAGLMMANPQPLNLFPGPGTLPILLSRPFAVDLVYVMYAYSGWNAAAYITDEVRNPAKNVPWALLIGTLVVTAFYLTLNFVFLRTTPKSVLAGQLEVGLLAGQAIFGPIGGKIVSLLIGLGLIATISAMAWIGPRITRRMAEDLPKLRLLGRSSKKGTPYVATILQVIIATLLVMTGTFETVLFYTQFSLILCSFLTVLGLIVLRVREPGLERPYRVWAYPVVPIFFLVVTLWMMIHVILGQPKESLLGLITVLAGLIIYFFAKEPGRPIHTQP